MTLRLLGNLFPGAIMTGIYLAAGLGEATKAKYALKSRPGSILLSAGGGKLNWL